MDKPSEEIDAIRNFDLKYVWGKVSLNQNTVKNQSPARQVSCHPQKNCREPEWQIAVRKQS